MVVDKESKSGMESGDNKIPCNYGEGKSTDQGWSEWEREGVGVGVLISGLRVVARGTGYRVEG